MTLLDLARRVSDDILTGSPPDGRDMDLVHELAFMRATSDEMPAPPMRPDLVRLIVGDDACAADG